MENDRIVASPCSNPELGLDEALSAYSEIGYRQFEVFTSWAGSAFDWNADPSFYIARGQRYGMRFPSLHLPSIDPSRYEETLAEAVDAATFASSIGADIVLYKANDRPTYIRAAKEFLDAVDDLEITPVVQNHFGSPLESLADMEEVITGIADPRMKSLLEVGHFHSAGVLWRQGYDLLTDSIALIHIKDQVGPQSVPFGKGEIDLPGLFEFMDSVGYTGKYVVEMEVKDHENTLQYLADALAYMEEY